MLKIEEIKKIDKKHIALMDTSSISFMQSLQKKEIMLDSILKDYELILIPKWVLTEIEDYEVRAKYVQKLIDDGYPIFSIAECHHEKSDQTLCSYDSVKRFHLRVAVHSAGRPLITASVAATRRKMHRKEGRDHGDRRCII